MLCSARLSLSPRWTLKIPCSGVTSLSRMSTAVTPAWLCGLYHRRGHLRLLLIFPITVVNGWEPYSILLSLSPMWTLEISFSTLPTISPMFTVGSSARLYHRCEHSRHPLFCPLCHRCVQTVLLLGSVVSITDLDTRDFFFCSAPLYY